MNQRTRTVLLVFIIALFSVVALGVTAVSAAPASGRMTYNDRTGKLNFVGASVANPVIVPGATAAGLSSAARAQAILDVYAPQFGVATQDLSFTREFITRDGRISRRYQQSYQGIPVFGGELIVNMTGKGGLLSMVGKASPSLAVGTVPVLTAAQAQQTAIGKAAKEYGVSASTLSAASASLWIFDERLLRDSNLRPELVYRVVVSSTVGAPIKAEVLVNAVNGGISLIYNTIDNGFAQGNPYAVKASNASQVVPRASDLATFTAGNTTSLPGTFLCDETDMTCTDGSDPDADAAHIFADGVYNMYFDWYGRDSLDDEGLQLISSVHFDLGYCNAFWNDVQMAYGDGCGSTIVLDDVVGHELTHGVTHFTSGLVYAYDSGAMNESFSDVWGEFFDLTNNSGDETAPNRWIVGEELGGIRDMQDPPSFGDPDRVLSNLFYLGEGDIGGVHTNSGVNNKAAYLMVDGDTFNGQTVVGLGIDKVAQIYYDTQTTKLNPTSEYIQLYDALQQSCTELIGQDGITAEDCDSVTAAVTATEMNQFKRPAAATAAVCETGVPDVIFSDDLESGSANWTTSGTTATVWALADTTQPLDGTASNFGPDLDVAGTLSLAMANDVSVPADAYLYFDQAYRFERDAVNIYDGGILEYSTDGGTTWTQFPGTAIEDGLKYKGTIANGGNNPLQGKSAFGGNSGSGVGSSRVSLAAVAGQNARFRWTIGADLSFNTQGWWVDNVSVYTCGTAPTGDNLVENGSFEATTARSARAADLTPWVVKKGAGDKIKCDTADKVVAHTGVCAFKFKGGAGESTKLQQTIDLAELTFTAGDTLNLSAFFDAKKATATGKIKITVAYGDSTQADKFKGSFGSTSGYEETTGTVNVSSSDVAKIKVMFINKSTSGKVFLDDVSLVQSTGDLLPIPAPLSLPAPSGVRTGGTTRSN